MLITSIVLLMIFCALQPPCLYRISPIFCSLGDSVSPSLGLLSACPSSWQGISEFPKRENAAPKAFAHSERFRTFSGTPRLGNACWSDKTDLEKETVGIRLPAKA